MKVQGFWAEGVGVGVLVGVGVGVRVGVGVGVLVGVGVGVQVGVGVGPLTLDTLSFRFPVLPL